MDDRRYHDEVATGEGAHKLRIVGRPGEGGKEGWLLLEEPGEPVLMHWLGRMVPHFKRDCPNCKQGGESPKPMLYVGALAISGAQELAILELTPKCLAMAMAESRNWPGRLTATNLFGEPIDDVGKLAGLMVEISRSRSARSPRVLRGMGRRQKIPEWPYRTREELARIWGIAVRPRLFRAEGDKQA